MNKPKKLLFVASEVYPFIKTGGLADVAYALPKALAHENMDIRVILPKYAQIPLEYREKMRFIGSKFINLAWRKEYIGIEELTLDGITYYFVDSERYFKRDKVYGEIDDCERFAFFSKGIIDTFDITGFTPDIIHCNDWHTGLIPVYLKDKQIYDPTLDIKTVYTIHNLRFQGVFSYENLKWTLGLEANRYFFDEGIKFHHNISFMKGGVNYSDLITTVSKTYAEEIQTPFYGENLDGLFRHNRDKLFGITNGIDYEIFNPERDPDLYINYGVDSLDKKLENKLYLQKKLKLTLDPEKPVVSIITRLDRQKGIHLIMAIFDSLMRETDLQFIVLGNGEPEYEEFFRKKALEYPDRVASIIGFNHTLSKEIYAGSDMLLMPSFFEPCGLSQLIAMRYGTVPLVRETGGLKDTVTPFNEYTHEGTGFSFTNYNAHDMLHVIKYAMDFYHTKKESWKTIVTNGMTADHSWTKASKKYMKLYNNLFL